MFAQQYVKVFLLFLSPCKQARMRAPPLFNLVYTWAQNEQKKVMAIVGGGSKAERTGKHLGICSKGSKTPKRLDLYACVIKHNRPLNKTVQ